MKNIGIFLLTAVLLFAFLPSKQAHACSCIGEDARARLERSGAVFVGTAEGKSMFTKSVQGIKTREYTFAVEQTWKGAESQSVSVHAYEGMESSCGISFEMRQSYLVYAFLDNQGQLSTDLCSGNLKLTEAAADIRQLGYAQEPETRPSAGPAHLSRLPWIGGIVLAAIIILLWRKRKKRELQ